MTARPDGIYHSEVSNRVDSRNELGHNCLYIGAALAEVLGFTCLTNPYRWFLLGALFAFCVWIIFLYDLRLIRHRLAECSTPNSCRLYEEVLRDQQLNIRFVIPAIFFSELIAALGIRARPDLFLDRGGHLFLILAAVLGLLIYLGLVTNSFVRMTPMIAATRADWRSGMDSPP